MDEEQSISERLLRLPVPHGKDYFCTILDYTLTHGRLVIQLDKRGWRTKNTLYLVFLGVVFFEGPTKWSSAEFQIASEAEFDLILSRLFYARPSQKTLKEHRKLFVVQTPNGPVKIMAYPEISRLKFDPGLPKHQNQE